MKKLLPASALLLAITIIVSSFIVSPKDPVRNVQGKESQKFAAKWTLDKGHSNVKFTVTHMVVSEVDGSFRTFDGTIEATKPDFSDAVVTFTVDVASVDTDNENRDKHLKSNDFFNA
jgi:polyisoprenoid-binding protein YceI